MRALLLNLSIAAALLLGGCYQSQTLLLDGRAPVTPITPGDYGSGNGTAAKKDFQIVFDRANWYRARRFDSKGVVIANLGYPLLINRWADLDGDGETVYAFAARDGAAYAYGLILIDEYRRITVLKPNCSGRPDREIAEALGATVEKIKSEKACVFTDAAQLKAALKQVRETRSAIPVQYRRM